MLDSDRRLTTRRASLALLGQITLGVDPAANPALIGVHS